MSEGNRNVVYRPAELTPNQESEQKLKEFQLSLDSLQFSFNTSPSPDQFATSRSLLMSGFDTPLVELSMTPTDSPEFRSKIQLTTTKVNPFILSEGKPRKEIYGKCHTAIKASRQSYTSIKASRRSHTSIKAPRQSTISCKENWKTPGVVAAHTTSGRDTDASSNPSTPPTPLTNSRANSGGTKKGTPLQASKVNAQNNPNSRPSDVSCCSPTQEYTQNSKSPGRKPDVHKTQPSPAAKSITCPGGGTVESNRGRSSIGVGGATTEGEKIPGKSQPIERTDSSDSAKDIMNVQFSFAQSFVNGAWSQANSEGTTFSAQNQSSIWNIAGQDASMLLSDLSGDGPTLFPRNQTTKGGASGKNNEHAGDEGAGGPSATPKRDSLSFCPVQAAVLSGDSPDGVERERSNSLLNQSFHFEVDYRSERFKYNVGERVMALWIDGKWYQADIASVLPSDRDDDTQWRVHFGCHITRIVESNQIKPAGTIFAMSEQQKNKSDSILDLLESFKEQVNIVEKRFDQISLYPFSSDVEQRHLTDLVECTLFTHLFEQNQSLLVTTLERLKDHKDEAIDKVNKMQRHSTAKLETAERHRQNIGVLDKELKVIRKQILEIERMLTETQKMEKVIMTKKEREVAACNHNQKELMKELERIQPFKAEAERHEKEYQHFLNTNSALQKSLETIQNGFVQRMDELESKVTQWSQREIIGWFSLLGGGRFCRYIDRFSEGVKSLKLTGQELTRLGDPMVLRLLGLQGKDLQDMVDEIARITTKQDQDASTITEATLNRCVICFENPKTHAFIPCGHRCVCDTCQQEIIQCPLCRLYVEKAVKIYV